MTNATLPTTEQLEAVLSINTGLSEMHNLGLLNDDRTEDFFSAAMRTLNLPLNEDEDNEREVFWTLCEERGLI
jgi:hypothetical protein